MGSVQGRGVRMCIGTHYGSYLIISSSLDESNNLGENKNKHSLKLGVLFLMCGFVYKMSKTFNF